MPDTQWQPNFNNPDPYEGMPPEYAEQVAQGYVPTLEHPLNPVQEAQQRDAAALALNAQPPEQAVPPPSAPAPQPPKPKVEVISPTSGADKYIVKVDGIQKLMSKSEIDAEGGKLPDDIRLASEVHQEILKGLVKPDEAYDKVVGAYEAQKRGMTLKDYLDAQLSHGVKPGDYIQNFADKYGMSFIVAAETLQRYADNPDAKEWESLNKWEKRDLDAGLGGTAEDKTRLTMQYAENHAWNVINDANKKNPKILTAVWEKGNQTNVLNLEEAVNSGITDPDIFNLIGKSAVRTRVKENSDDPGTLFPDGFGGITKNQLEEIKTASQERKSLNALLKEKGLTGQETADTLIKYGIGDVPTLKKLGWEVTEKDIKSVKDFNEYIKADDTPQELKDAYQKGGYDAYMKAYDARQSRLDKESIEFNRDNVVDASGKYMSLTDFGTLDEKYQSIVIAKGFDEMERVAKEDNVKQDAALSSLTFALNKDGSYDFDKLASYARTHKDAEQTFKDAGFTEVDKLNQEIKAYNESPITYYEYKRRYFEDKGVEYLSNTSPQLLKMQLSPKNSLEYKAFLENSKLSSQARAEYIKKYGMKDLLGSAGSELVSPVFPPARVLRPDVELKDISGLEWAIGVAQVALFAVPVAGGVVGKVAGAIAGRLTGAGITTAAGGVFTYDTVKNWSTMTTAERRMAVAMDTMILGGAAFAAAGTLPKLEAAKGKANAKISESVKPNVTPEQKAYNASYDITKAVKKTVEALKSERGGSIPTQEIAKSIQNALDKTKYEMGQAKITAKNIAKSVAKELNNPSLQSERGGGLTITKSIPEIVGNAVGKAKFELTGTGIKLKQVSGAISKELNNPSLQAEKGGTIPVEKIEASIKKAFGKLKYNTKGMEITIKKMASNIADKINNPSLKGERGGVLPIESTQKAISSALGKVKYSAKVTGAEIGRFAKALNKEVNNPSLQSERGGVIKVEGIEKAIKNAMGKTKYGVKITASEIKTLAENVSKELNNPSLQSERGGVYTNEAIANAIKRAIGKAKYNVKGAKLIGTAVEKGIKDAQANYGKLSADDIKATIDKINEAAKRGDIEGVKKAGEDLQNIGNSVPKEQGGEIISRQGKQVADKAAEIVKIAEKRLTTKQLKQLTDGMEGNADFIQSPSQKVVAEYQRIESDITKTRKQIQDNQSLLNKSEYELEHNPKIEIKKSNMTKAEVEAEKVRLTQQLSRDNAQYAELANQGGEPADLHRIMTRMNETRAELAKLELAIEPAGIDPGKLKQHAQDELKRLNWRLAEKVRQRNELLASDKATKLWGSKIAGQEPRTPLDYERLSPQERTGPEKGARVTTIEKVERKVEVKPKTEVKEKIKQAEPDIDKLKKAKEKVEQEKKTAEETKIKEKTKPAEKQKSKTTTQTRTGEDVTIPQQVGIGHWALVWDVDGIHEKWIAPERLPEGFVSTWSKTGAKTGAQSDIERRYDELLTKTTQKTALKTLIKEYPDKSNYPIVLSQPSTQAQAQSKSAQNQPQPQPKPSEFKQPIKQPQPSKEKPQPRTEQKPVPVQKPTPRPVPKPQPKPQPQPPGPKVKEPDKTKKKPPIELPSGGSPKKEWTPEDVKSAIAWRDGFAVHAIKSPYRRGLDEKSYNIDHLPEGLIVMKNYKGEGSQQRSAKPTGKLPGRLTVDVGNQDVVITKGKGGQVQLRHFRDTRGSTSQTTISKGRNISQKRGRIYHTRAGGGTILGRRPIRGY